ncbi:hypothetical protein GIB67_041703 [Kingdonia uniflora]|uniref:Protein kinase domain-containing protein n=1 Tax=Kingdonia uniflora TaxID=39325 RepID=A0A7J7MR37_9MAGN|nr:hypothetical protein GIB67_041703 [Kingdonia uniflora]
MAPRLPYDDEGLPYALTTAVGIDKDKNTTAAVKWAVENLLENDPTIILVHVRVRTLNSGDSTPQSNRVQTDAELKQLFLPFRGFCARKKVQVKEVILDDMDVTEAIIAYVKSHCINNVVVGASTRNALTRRLKNPDVATCLTKCAPDYVSVYVISKGKAVTAKSASRPAPRLPPPHPIAGHCEYSDHEDHSRPTSFGKVHGRNPVSWERSSEYNRSPARDKSATSTPRSSNHSQELMIDHSMYKPKTFQSLESASDEGDFNYSYRTCDMPSDSLELYSNISGSPGDSYNSTTSSIDMEMRKLKLELKQTMDMYSSACKEAISAKQKAENLNHWKMEESHKVGDARVAEETALAMAKMEKAKCMVAMEAADAAQRLAELELKKRKDVDKKGMLEGVERRNVLDVLSRSDIQYRKYALDELREATSGFSESLMIGEGGYGPVFRAILDHTPVAIKVLRPDAAQGMKQFQQEVEVLSCVRHPNMVLLLGACPESGCLVYEYMDNGSLDDRLFRRENTPTIPWRIRFKIAAEIATGLLFLHQTKPEPLVHRDLKPGNILLDQNYVSKISDVGLARLVPPSVADSVTQYHMTSAAGTFCYIDPEYQQTGMLGTKSDIYSLGIMLLQIITAKAPMGLAHLVEMSIEDGTFEDILDPTVRDWPIEETLTYAKLALQCAELRRKDRPDLGTILLPELNRLKEFGILSQVSTSSGSSFGVGYGQSPYSTSSRLDSYHANSHLKTSKEAQRLQLEPGAPFRSIFDDAYYNNSNETYYSNMTAPTPKARNFVPRKLPEYVDYEE